MPDVGIFWDICDCKLPLPSPAPLKNLMKLIVFQYEKMTLWQKQCRFFILSATKFEHI